MIDWLIALQRPWPFPKYRLINPFLPANGIRRAHVFGAEFDLDLSDLIQRDVYVGCYERNETAIFKRILKHGDTLLDCGANIGYFTALGSSLVGHTGRVISVEPNPSAFAKLDSMAERSGLTWCSRFNIGLSDVAGHITLYEPPSEHHNLNSTMIPVENYKPINVPIRTLEDLLDEQNVKVVDLMKVDVEGHEPKVFAGGSKSLTDGRVKHIVCEFNEYWLKRAGSSSKQLLSTLKGYGFHVIAGSEAELDSNQLVNLMLRHSSVGTNQSHC